MKVSCGRSVTRGAERGVTQVQSSAAACPWAIPAQQKAGSCRASGATRPTGWLGKKWAEKTSEEGIQYFILTNAALFKAALIFLAWVNFVIDKTKISIKACVYELHRNRDNIPRTSIKGFKETFASFNYISLKNDK